MRILITGGSGLLGGKLLHTLNRKYDVIGTYLNNERRDCIKLDITNANEVNLCINELSPKLIIHTAAIADPDICEQNKDLAWKVNVEGTRNIVNACYRRRIKLIYISTDYIFDGRKGSYNEDDKAHPVNYYGTTKYEGEKIVNKALEDYLILRIPIFYGFNDEQDKVNFVTKTIRILEKDKEIYEDDKQIRYPVFVDDVVQLLAILIEKKLDGTLHFSGSEEISKYKWACKIAKVFNFSPKRIKPLAVNKKGAPRPQNSKLGMTRLQKAKIVFNTASIEEGCIKMQKQMNCSFRVIYNMKPDMLICGKSASSFRMKIGRTLAEEHPADADYVVGIPESGIFPATGYSMCSGIPFCHGIIRDYYTSKTLFRINLEERLNAIRKKLIVVPDILKNKSIVLIDEAIISGATLKVAIEKLREASVAKIHVRIPSPPMLSNCSYGILNSKAKLVAQDKSIIKNNYEASLADYLGCDSLKFLDLNSFINLINGKKNHCFECFIEGGSRD